MWIKWRHAVQWLAVALTTGDTGKHSRGVAWLLVCCPVLQWNGISAFASQRPRFQSTRMRFKNRSPLGCSVPTTMSPPLVCELCRLLRNYTPTTRDYRSIYLSMLCPCPFSQYIIYYYLLFAFLKLNSRTALQRRHFGSTIINYWRGVGFFVRFYNIIIIICLWLHHHWSEEFLEMILRFQFSLPKNREPTEGGGGLEHSRPGYLPFPHSFNHHFYPDQLRWWSLLSIFVLYLSMGRLCCLVWYALQVLCGLCGEARLSIYDDALWF